MKEIQEFLIKFIKAETQMEEAFRKRDLELHNKMVDNIQLLCAEELKLASKEYEPLSMIGEMRIAQNGNLPVYPRYLYKISEYNHAVYGKLWACYVSVANPIQDKVKSIFDCFIVGQVNGNLKIVADFIPDSDSTQWTFVGGDRNIKYYELGEPVAIERLLEPVVNEWSIEEYLQER